MDGIPLVFGVSVSLLANYGALNRFYCIVLYCIDHRATLLGSYGNEAVFYVVPWNTMEHELRGHLFEFHGIPWNNGPMEFQDLIVFHGSSRQVVFHGIP